MLNTNSLGAFIRILCSAKFRLRYYLDGINIPKRRLTLNTLRIRITRTNLNTLPALPIRTVSWQDNIYLIIQSLDHLESVHDEADEVWEDGEQVHHVQGRRHELQLAGGTEEAHRVLWARVRIYGLDNSNICKIVDIIQETCTYVLCLRAHDSCNISTYGEKPHYELVHNLQNEHTLKCI